MFEQARHALRFEDDIDLFRNAPQVHARTPATREQGEAMLVDQCRDLSGLLLAVGRDNQARQNAIDGILAQSLRFVSDLQRGHLLSQVG